MSVEPQARLELLRASCARIRQDAESLCAAASGRSPAGLERHRAELTSHVAEHLRLVDELLSSLAKRALLRDHRRLEQLVRAIDLATGDDDLSLAASAARKLAAFMVDHDTRESG